MWGYIFGIGAIVSLFISHQKKSRRGILIFKLCADLFWAAHYFSLGAIAGVIPNFVGIFRELVFIRRGQSRLASKAFWPFLFILVNLSLGIASFDAWYDILPLVASAFVTVSLWINNPHLTKCISIPVSAAFLIYDIFVGSYVGIVNEAMAILSILLFFIRRRQAMKIFQNDYPTTKELKFAEGAPIKDVARTITADVSKEALAKGEAFSKEIGERFVSDFEKPGDKMAHVSTFLVIGDTVYMTYYANTKEPSEDPENQTARLVYAPLDNIENKTFMDLQTTGDKVGDKIIDMVYDTILMQKDEDTLFVMWTARTEENYYRFYCPFSLSTKTLGKIGVHKFKVGNITNDLSASGIRGALAENGILCKKMYSDIGIMQKQSFREENGVRYCYSGLYSGDFTCIIKSHDLITWEYVSQPDFINDSRWENATYVIGDKIFYFVRQQDSNPCGFLTAYNIKTQTWDTPVEIEDCQSRGDFIFYRGALYLFHAPIDREHIGIVKIDTEDTSKSEVVLQAKMPSSCFYPFVQYFANGELAMSYTVARKHIRLARFSLEKYL